MIPLDPALFGPWLASFFWPLCRISGIFFIAPVLSNGAIPNRVKVVMASMVAIVVAPLVNVADPSLVFTYQGVAIALRELMIGMMVGFLMRLAYSAAEIAGGIVGISSGLSFASVYSPQTGSFGDPLARFFHWVAIMVFIGMSGHVLMLKALAESFRTLPIEASFAFGNAWVTDMVAVGAKMFGYGLLLLLPLVATLVITNIALGILSRSAPQMNLFAVGFQITLIVTFLLIIPTTGVFAQVLERFYEDIFLVMQGWLG